MINLSQDEMKFIIDNIEFFKKCQYRMCRDCEFSKSIKCINDFELKESHCIIRPLGVEYVRYLGAKRTNEYEILSLEEILKLYNLSKL